MEKTFERKTVLTVGEKITRVNIIDEGNAVEIFSISDEKVKEKYIEEYFPIVKVSELSLEDRFLKHRPRNKKQKTFKKMLISVIKSELSDFRAQRMDPSVNEEGKIFYQAGKKSAIGKSADWWKKNAEEFMPEKESRLGTTKERIAFLGLLIKYLNEERKYTINHAWEAVCNKSKELGHFNDSKDTKHEVELTGDRKVGEWYDLANTFKITINSEKNNSFLLFGSNMNHSLVDIEKVLYADENYDDCIGWIVISV